MKKAWIITADMGYGHQRAVYPLKALAQDNIITANNDSFNSAKESKLWERTLRIYEMLSRTHSIPIIGKYIFSILDYFLKIPPEFEHADLSNITFQVKTLEKYINKGLCAGVLKRMETKNLPLVTSFYAPAIAADLNQKKDVYCIICDADLNRVWVARKPKKSHIKYFVPTQNAYKRLQQYGVKEKYIFYTGFPLPLEVLGNKDLSVLKTDLKERIQILDVTGEFQAQHKSEIKTILNNEESLNSEKRPFTITFAVGGAGAQIKIGEQIANSLKDKILKGNVQLNLIAGTRRQVKYHFERIHKEEFKFSPNLHVVFGDTKDDYFSKFNQVIRTTDVLWTKPSELSFYCALGIPIIMAPPIGSQEKFNKKWLEQIGAGIPQQNPKQANSWLIEMLENGKLVEAAWSGFVLAKKYGSYRIMDFIETGCFNEKYNNLID